MVNLKTYESIEEIAIIGMAGQFPQAKNLEEFWQNLCDGVESISCFTDAELTTSGIESAVLNDPNYVKAGAVLADIELFDAAFFGFNPREAELTDPQHRLFLECAWQALETAGYDSQRCKSRIGVYGGASLNNYHAFDLNRDRLGSAQCYQTLIGNDKDFLTTRVSYKLNLTGPSITVQTACSTSLVATTLACQSLLNYQCDIALAGGVSIHVPQKSGYLSEQGGTLSPDGHCYAFDARAKGTTIGNGVGIVVLKRLAEAIADGDYIYAVIKGCAINNDGALKVGYTAPSLDGQAEVIAEAMMLAGVEPETVNYIEAHGTGTSLGDPIEIAALSQVFRTSTDQNNCCAIGSVKTNIGHLDAAAGIAGLLKTILALKHQLIPPSLNFEQPNPQIDFANSPFYVNTKLAEWKAGYTPRRAGVSSLGIGGTNAHVILEEAPKIPESGTSRPWQLLVISAKTQSALETATQNLAQHLKQHSYLNLADVAHTLQVGRREFNHRRVLVCQDIEDAINQLQRDDYRISTQLQEPGERSLVFMFPGQGAQYADMGRELYQTEPIFQEQVDHCSHLLEPHLGLDLRSLIYPSESEAEAAVKQLNQTQFAQPALFVIEYALAQLWMSWGIVPQAAIGHSIGEYVAACLADVMSLADALALVAVRGRLMQQLPRGAMLSIPLSEAEVRDLIGKAEGRGQEAEGRGQEAEGRGQEAEGRGQEVEGKILVSGLSLAAINAPTSCVVSGTDDAVKVLQAKLLAQGINSRRLHTSHAFHSPMMDAILEPFTQEVNKVKLHPPKIKFISNITGTWITATEATDSSYWARHLRQTVNFSSGIAQLLQQPNSILLEVGPGNTLCTFVNKHSQQTALPSLRHPKEQKSDVGFLLSTLGKLWLSGVQVNWSEFYSHERRHRLPLPTYPFERQRYWIGEKAEGRRQGAEGRRQEAEGRRQEAEGRGQEVEGRRQEAGGRRQGAEGKLPAISSKTSDVANWFYVPSWKRSLLPNTRRSPQPPLTRGAKFSPSQGGRGGIDPDKSVLSCTLVFTDECGLGEQLVQRLQEGQDVITVRVGAEFRKLSDRLYTLNPHQRNDYDALLKELSAQGKFPQAIAHLGNVTPNEEKAEGRRQKAESRECFETCQHLGFYSLLFLAQALGKQLTESLQITVISNNMQQVTGSEVLCPEKALAIGAVKVIPQEYPNLSCQSIDIEMPSLGSWQAEQLINQLLDELQTQSSDSVIAYRGNHRWVEDFQPVQLPGSGAEIPRLREKGVYLITGGLGGIGLVLAEYLAQTVRAKLLLTGRSAFPARDKWQEWLTTHNPEDDISCKIRQLMKLKQLGAEVLVVSADVSNFEQMQSALAEAENQFGKFNGVIHAAGIPSGGVIQRKTPQMIARILEPKVKGTLVLNHIFQEQLDFFVLCSSLTSIRGEFGQVDYAAANAFLDTFAHYKTNRDSTFTVAINWSTWQEVGMAAEAAKQSRTLDTKPRSQEVTHPLFDRCIVEGSQNIYISKFSVIKHWVLDEHRVMGKATLPGTAYLEMARAAFEHHTQQETTEQGSRQEAGGRRQETEGNLTPPELEPPLGVGDSSPCSLSVARSLGLSSEGKPSTLCPLPSAFLIEIREVYFLHPLVVEADAEKEVRTILKKQGDSFEFSIISQVGEQWLEHARGEIAWVESSPVKYDIKQIAARCNEQEIITSEHIQAGYIEFGSRWHNFQQGRFETNQGFAILELEEEFAADINFYKLHPALLDNATGFLRLKESGAYLPFSYKRLRISAPLPQKIYSYIRYAENDQPRTETLKFDITIMDHQGRGLVEIEEYTLRKVDVEAIATNQTPPENQNFSLQIASPGNLDTLRFQATTRQQPSVGEVEIEVGATGLNFKEVLLALGMLPVPPNVEVKFGLECAGKIVALGEGVEGLAIGDEVIAFGDACFSRFITTSALAVAPKPAHLSLEAAATIPVAFTTAYYALIKLGRLSRGDRVLIHAAAGGVGMAAVQIAQWVGAEIFATAGNSEKREFLHSKGINHVMDSRSVAFAEQVMQLTNGKGVDVVLNSLAGEFMTKSLDVLAPYGRFLEIGKRDILNNSQLGLRVFEKCLSFFAINVDRNLPNFNHLWCEVVQHFQESNFSPLPHQVFPISSLAGAFAHMARAKHIGKIVVSMQDRESLKIQVATDGQKSPSSEYKIKNGVASANSYQTQLLQQGLLPTEGVEAFSRILGSTFSQVLVSTHDFRNQVYSPPHLEALEEHRQPTQPRPELSNAYVAPRNEIEQKITTIWQELLGRQVGVRDNFFDLGGDSLLMVQVRSKLQAALNCNISTSDLFEYSTISALAEYLSCKQVEPAFEQAQERAKKQEAAMAAERELINKRRVHE